MNADAFFREHPRAVAVDERIRVVAAVEDAFHTRGEDRFRARRRASDVVARLERNVQVGAARSRAGLAQRDHFRVRSAGLLVVPARDDTAISDDERADRRIRMRPPSALLGLAQSQTHELVRAHFFGAIFRSEISSLSSLMNSLRSLKLR